MYDFVFNPFTIHLNSDDDDALMTKGQFKKLNEKLNSLLESSKYSSSSNWEYMMTTHKATVEMLTKEYAKVLEDSSKAITASEKTILDTTAKVEKLRKEVTTFIAEFRTSSESNTEAVNKVIAGFSTSLQAGKQALSVVRSAIKVDDVELNASILTKIEKLQQDLAAENKIMDQLAEKIQKAKVLSEKVKNASRHIVDLEDERAISESYVSEINQYLIRLVQNRKSLFTVSVRQHLSDKLQPVFPILNQIEDVSGSEDFLKKGGDKDE